jgi:hypothetical protein
MGAILGHGNGGAERLQALRRILGTDLAGLEDGMRGGGPDRRMPPGGDGRQAAEECGDAHGCLAIHDHT